MKKWLSLCLIVFLCLPWASSARGIHSLSETIPLAKGVTLTRVRDFYADHNISYSVIEADLTEETVHFAVLTPSGGIDTLSTVGNLAASKEDTVAALNADFFSSVSGGKALSLGIEIKDGELLQSPINPDTMVTVAATDDVLSLSYLDFHIMAVAPDWSYQEVRHLNKHTSYYGDILMYTAAFNGGYSPAPGGEVVEVVVEDGIVTEFRRNMPPVKIPENGCVLVVSEGVNMFFSNSFSVGDPIRFDYYITPDLSDADTALGGGAMLVKDGMALSSFSHVISGYNPRSALGIDKSGTRLYLVAVDGRQEQSRGMTMSELAALMVELGCDSAVNLDGGGSTNMVASDVWQSALHTVNSPTENRRVVNAAAVTVTSSREPASLLLQSDTSAVFLGQTAVIRASVLDEGGRACDAPVSFSASGGSMNGAVFTAEEGGTAIITATCGEINASLELPVIDAPAGLLLSPFYRMNPGESQTLSLTAFDEAGHQAPLANLAPVTVTSSNPSVVSFANGRLYAHTNGRAVLTVSLGDATSYTAVTVGSDSYTFVESFEEEDAATFASYPAYVGGSLTLSDMSYKGDFALGLSYDFTAETDDTQAAYAVLGEGVPLADDCRTISLYCYTETPFLHSLKLQCLDGAGGLHRISADHTLTDKTWQRLTFTVPDDLPRPLSLDRLYAVALPGEAHDEGILLFDELTCLAAEAIDPPVLPQNIIVDSKMHGGAADFRCGISSPSNTLINQRANASLSSALSASGHSMDLASTEYSALDAGDALYITLNTASGGLRKSNASQWTAMDNAIRQSNAPCLVIASSDSLFGSDAFENDILRSYLSSLSKTVVVITPGEQNTLLIDGGVRYFTLAPITAGATLAQGIAQLSFLELSFSGGLSYRFTPLWP